MYAFNNMFMSNTMKVFDIIFGKMFHNMFDNMIGEALHGSSLEE